MNKQSSYQKLKAENKALKSKITDIEYMFGLMGTDEKYTNQCAGFISMCRMMLGVNKMMSDAVMFGNAKRDISKMYFTGLLWDSPQIIKPTKNTWFSKIINNFTKYLYGRKR